MQDLTGVPSSSSLSTSNSLSNNNVLSPLFTALGWKDLKPAIAAAEQMDRFLALELQQAYDSYSTTPNEASKQRLHMALDHVIGELQADLARLKKLEKQAAKRLAKPQTNSGSYLASWGNWFKQGAQAFFGSDDASLVERYGDIVKKREQDIVQLSRLRAGLSANTNVQQAAGVDMPKTEAADLVSAMGRRLLATESPVVILPQQYCLPSGSCDLSNFHDGASGFVLQGEASSDFNGFSVSSAGDVNGDGVDDGVIGAPNAGKSYVVFGSRNNSAWGDGTLEVISLMDGQRGFVLQGSAGDQSGWSVSSAGDINDDGLDDLVIGAYAADPSGRTNAGKSYVVFGSRNNTAWGNGTLDLGTLMDGHRGFVLQGEAADDWSGWSVSSAGDMNGDGLSDVVIGAPAAGPNGRNTAGKSYVVFGSRNSTAWGNGTLELSALRDGVRGFVLQGEADSDRSGSSVSSAGDVNGDGLADLLIGVYRADPSGRTDAGKSYVVFGSRNNTAWGNGTLDLSSLMDGARGFVLQGEAAGSESGSSVSSAGDINGDGVGDLVVIEGGLSSNRWYRSYVTFGSTNSAAWGNGTLDIDTLMNGVRGFALEGPVMSAGSPGDVNGDGVGDLMLGDSAFSGKSYVIFGSTDSSAWGSGILTSNSLANGLRGFVLQGEAINVRMISSVSSAVDINGDGVSDLILGVPRTQTGKGKSQVVLGLSHPLQWANELTVYNGLTTRLSGQNLNVTYSAPVQFNVTSVSNGRFEYITNPGRAITLFNQSAVGEGQIQFAHSGNSLVPSYSLQVLSLSRFIQFIPQSATITFYEFYTTNQLTIHQGEVLRINRTFLDAYSNYTAEQVIFTVSSLQHGQFLLEPLNNSIAQFSQSDILAGQVLFTHDDSRTTPSFHVEITDPGNTLLSANPSAVTFYRRPVWVTNQLTLTQGETMVLGASQVNITADVPSNRVLFTVSSLQHGQFQLTSSNSSLANFTQQQLLAGQVSFRHDNIGIAPSYQLRLSDDYFILPPEPAGVTFTALPPLLTNNSLTVYQGRHHTLSSANLRAADPDSTLSDSALVFTVSNVQHGQFMLNGSAVIVMQFTQAQIKQGRVLFIQDDSTSAPSYQVAVGNPYRNTTAAAANISFDKRPTIINNRLTIETGESVVLAPTNLQAVDDHTPSAELLFTVSSVNHGYFSELQAPNVSITAFSQQRVRDFEIQFTHDGSPNAPFYAVKAVDGSGLESSQANAQINFKNTLASNEFDWEALYASLSTIGGVIVSVGGYFWWRHVSASHRQGYDFANALRSAADLQYHDFTRSKGELYKSKVELFLAQLRLPYSDFYDHLTPDQKNSFAVCVAQVLDHRFKLLEPSDCSDAAYGCFFGFSQGWSQKLKLREFEAQVAKVAREAVATWQAEPDPLTRWPYRTSPSLADKIKTCCCSVACSSCNDLPSAQSVGQAVSSLISLPFSIPSRFLTSESKDVRPTSDRSAILPSTEPHDDVELNTVVDGQNQGQLRDTKHSQDVPTKRQEHAATNWGEALSEEENDSGVGLGRHLVNESKGNGLSSTKSDGRHNQSAFFQPPSRQGMVTSTYSNLSSSSWGSSHSQEHNTDRASEIKGSSFSLKAEPNKAANQTSHNSSSPRLFDKSLAYSDVPARSPALEQQPSEQQHISRSLFNR